MKDHGIKLKPKAAARAESSDKARAESSNKARAESSTFLDADKWLEHLEEEIEPTCLSGEKADLDLVLKNSAEDLELRQSLQRLRAAVKSTDDVALPESGDYYDTLHSKIMSAIDDDIAMNGEPVREASRTRRPVIFAKRFPQALFGAFGMTMMIAVLAFVGLHNRSMFVNGQQIAADASSREASIEQNFERKIAMVDSRSGARFAREMGSFESEEDFLTETAAARLKQVSAQQADSMLRDLTR